MLLQRSGEHSLDVIIFPSYPGSTPRSNRYSHALDASAHSSRIRKLLIFPSENRNEMKHFVRIFSKPAPNLTHLELAAFLPVEKTISFPNLFGLDFPKLRVLKVSGVEAWPEIVGANLTSITINVSFDPQLLKRCIPYSPNLRVLKFRSIWEFTKPDLSAWPRIALPPRVSIVIKSSRMCPHILALFSLPRDGHIKVEPPVRLVPTVPLLSYVLPTEISHLQNLRTLTRLHMKTRLDAKATFGLKCFKLDRPAFEVDVEYPFGSRAMAQKNASPVMWFWGSLHQIVLRGVEELRMEGFVGPLEPQAAELLAFLKRMPALLRLVTTDDNEEIFRSTLDSLGCQAVVIRVDQ